MYKLLRFCGSSVNPLAVACSSQTRCRVALPQGVRGLPIQLSKNATRQGSTRARLGFGVFGFLPSTDTIIHPKPRKVNPFLQKKCSLYTFTDNTIFSRSFLLKVNKRGRGWDKLEGLDGGGCFWKKLGKILAYATRG